MGIKMTLEYNVVFQNTRELGPWRGIRTINSFRSKEDFENWYTPEQQAVEKAIAKGVTEEEAVNLAKKTPLACRCRAALDEATDEETGRINLPQLEMRVMSYDMLLPNFGRFFGRYRVYLERKLEKEVQNLQGYLSGVTEQKQPEQVTAHVKIFKEE